MTCLKKLNVSGAFLTLAPSQRGAGGGGGGSGQNGGPGSGGRVGVPARGVLRPAWEYREPGPPNKPRPRAFPENV